MKQLIGKYMIDCRVVGSQVLTLLLPNEVAIIFGTFPTKNCLVEKVRDILKEGGQIQEAKMVKQFAKDKDFKKLSGTNFKNTMRY